MDYQYDIINYTQKIPAAIMRMSLSSDTRQTELQWHREPELVYVTEGRAECSCNGETTLVEQGDFILLNSEDVHLLRAADEVCRLFCVNFSFEYIRMFYKSVESLFFDVDDKPEVKAEIANLLRELSEIDETENYAALIQNSYINKIYYLLLKNCLCFRRSLGSGKTAKRDFSYAKTAIAYINENYKNEISLDEISSVVSLSPSYFSKYFKSVTRVSFSDYLANLRLENAVNDMLNFNFTVSAAARDNGFANVKSFITQCKKVYGCTPAQYKKKLLSKNAKNVKPAKRK